MTTRKSGSAIISKRLKKSKAPREPLPEKMIYYIRISDLCFEVEIIGLDNTPGRPGVYKIHPIDIPWSNVPLRRVKVGQFISKEEFICFQLGQSRVSSG